MNNELRVRKSPHGTLVVYEMVSPMSVGWRVVRVGAGDTRLNLGYWVTEQEAALWQVATWGPDPARVDEPEPKTCTTTHSVATGYGVLDCDGDHSGGGMHHDRTHRLVWSACHDECCGGAA